MIARRVAVSALHSIVRGSSSSLLDVVPGAQEVARAEQLGGRVVADRGLAHEQPLERSSRPIGRVPSRKPAPGVQRPRGMSITRA